MKKIIADLWKKKFSTKLLIIFLIALVIIPTNVTATKESTLTDGNLHLYIIDAPLPDSDFLIQNELPIYYNFVFLRFVVFNVSENYPLIIELNDNTTEIIEEGVYSFIIEPKTNSTYHLVLRTRYKILYSSTFFIVVTQQKEEYVPLRKYLHDLRNLEQQTVLLTSMIAVLGIVSGVYGKKYTQVTTPIFIVLYALPLIFYKNVPYVIPLAISSIISYTLIDYGRKLYVLKLNENGDITYKKYTISHDGNYILKSTPSIEKRGKFLFTIHLQTKKFIELRDTEIKNFGAKNQYVIAIKYYEKGDKLHIIGIKGITKALLEAKIIEKMDKELSKSKLRLTILEEGFRQIIVDKVHEFLNKLTGTDIEKIDFSNYFIKIEEKLRNIKTDFEKDTGGDENNTQGDKATIRDDNGTNPNTR